ncbi:MAG: lysylphosphatidylglycerol synthase transmembrane domain-containing protein [Anaerolineales bacterium]
MWGSFLLAAFLLFFALRGFNWEFFIISLKNVSYGYLFFIFFWSSFSYFIRALRWRILIISRGDISIADVFWANMTGYLGNNILPARAGELIRAAYVSKVSKASATFAIATGLVERFFDLIFLIILSLISLSFVGGLSELFVRALRIMAFVAGLGALFIIFTPFVGNWILTKLTSWKWRASTFQEKILGFLEQFFHGVEAFHNFRRVFLFTLFTFLIWLMDGLGAVLLAKSLQVSLSLMQSFLFLSMLGISSAIPSTPGYVGVYQFVAVTVLQPFGFTREIAIAFALMIQFMNLLVTIFWGGLGLWVGSRSVVTENKAND